MLAGLTWARLFILLIIGFVFTALVMPGSQPDLNHAALWAGLFYLMSSDTPILKQTKE